MAKKVVSVIDLDQLIDELANYKDKDKVKKYSFPVQLSDYSSFYSELYTKLSPSAKKILILLEGEKKEVRDIDTVIDLLKEIISQTLKLKNSSPIMKNIRDYSKILSSLKSINKFSKKILESFTYISGFKEHGLFGDTSYDNINENDLELGYFHCLDLDNFYKLGQSLLSIASLMKLSESIDDRDHRDPFEDHFNLILSSFLLIHNKIIPDVLYKKIPAYVGCLLDAIKNLEKDLKPYRKILTILTLLKHLTRAKNELESMLSSKELKEGKLIKIENFFGRKTEITHIEKLCQTIMKQRDLLRNKSKH
ncbi:MAG: hypothetical protein ACTSVZ_05670 [Promethearchaeota archaeon]